MANNAIRANTGTYGVNDQPQIGPLMQGQAGVVMTFTLTDLGGTAINLTGKTITGTITNNQSGATAALAGALALVTPASGIFSWTTDAADVGTAGDFSLVFTAGATIITLPAHLAILETPAATTTFGTALVGVTVAQAAWLATALATLPDAADLATFAADVDDLATATGNSGEMVRVAAAGGLEYRTPAQVLDAIAALPEKAVILSKAANYELAAGDEGKIVECDGTFTVTLPDGLDTGFQAVVVNIGSGTITLTAATTLTSKDSATDLANQYGAATVYHAGSNVWRAFGDIE